MLSKLHSQKQVSVFKFFKRININIQYLGGCGIMTVNGKIGEQV